VRHVGDELRAEHVEICAVGPGEDHVELRAGAGWLREACDVAELIGCLGTQVAFTVVAGEPVVVPDLAREKRFRVPPSLVECGAASSLSVVVRGQPHTAGVLTVYTWRPREFSQSDVSFARAVADVLASAMREDASDRALREGAERMRAVLETVIEGIITIDERGVVEAINPAACRLFGYERDEVVGRNVKILMPEPYQGEHDGYLRNYLETGQAKIIGIGREVSGLRKDGSVFPLQLGVSEFHVGGRRMFAGVLRDITEQRRLEREILEIGAQEQRRIGQDLHDGLCQELTGITFALEVLGQKLAKRAAPETASIRKVGELVDQTIGHARALAHGLQPVTLDAAGLAAALRELAAKVENMFRVSCLFVSESDVLVHDNVVATHVFRIAQEAISNAVKHGKAKTIVLDLASSDGWLRLTVSDDGVGLDRTSGAGGGKGIGMQTMGYRARVVGGRLDVRPGERGGTVVVCTVPIRGVPGAGGTIERSDTNVDKTQANRQQPQQPAVTPTRRARGGRTGQGRAAKAKGVPRR
jgi:two-component system, LuxR family, sensor kinase FixL